MIFKLWNSDWMCIWLLVKILSFLGPDQFTLHLKLAADIWPDPTTCHAEPFQPINWRLTSGLGKKCEGDANNPRQSVTMNFANYEKKIFLHPANASPRKTVKSNASTLEFIFSDAKAWHLVEEGQLVKICENYFQIQAKVCTFQKCARALFLLRRWLCTAPLPFVTKHFVPKSSSFDEGKLGWGSLQRLAVSSTTKQVWSTSYKIVLPQACVLHCVVYFIV